MKITLATLTMYCKRLAGCLIWQQGTTRNGYPQANINGETWLVAHYVWRVLLGNPKPPRNQALVPKCGRIRCIDPSCIHLVSRGDILRRDYAQDRRPRSSRTPAQQQALAINNGWAKLDVDKRKNGQRP